VAQELMPFRKAMYHAMMGENLTGKQAAEQGLVTESVPGDQLKARVTEIAEVLLKKDQNALRATKWAMRRMSEMTYDNAEDYLIRAQEALNGMGGLAGARKRPSSSLMTRPSSRVLAPSIPARSASNMMGRAKPAPTLGEGCFRWPIWIMQALRACCAPLGRRGGRQ
jgi:hypothetical protein